MVKAVPVLNDEFRNAIIQMGAYGGIFPILIALAVNVFNFPWHLVLVVLPLIIWGMVKKFSIGRKIGKGMKAGKLVIEKEKIILQDGQGKIMEENPIFSDSELFVKGYFTGTDTQAPIWKKASEDKPINLIRIQNRDGMQKEYNFLLESDYMKVQLKNLVQHWKAKGLKVEEVISE